MRFIKGDNSLIWVVTEWNFEKLKAKGHLEINLL